MAFIVDDDGNITLVQGDSGQLVVEDLPTDKNYTVYFAICNSNRVRVGTEISVAANQSPTVVFEITATLTDLLTVPLGEEMAEYYYGIKICDSLTNLEDTLCINNGDIGDINSVFVYPRKVEGLT